MMGANPTQLPATLGVLMATTRRTAAALLAAAVTVAVSFSAPDVATARPGSATTATAVPALPLGPAGTTQTATEQSLAPGVRLTTIVAGKPSASDSWVLRSLQVTQAAAEELAARIRAQGYPATVQRIDDRAADDPERGPLGWLVVSEGFATEADAGQARTRLTAAGVTGLGVSNTALYKKDASGPWVVRVLEVDRKHLRQVHATLATDIIPSRETTSSVAARTGSVAAVNGGYFVVGTADGVPGDLAGIGVQDGVYDSEAVADRAALIVDANRSDVAVVNTRQRLRSSDGATRLLNGVDRAVGRIRSCGAPGDVPTERPLHDVTCTNPDEIVVFDRSFGPTAEEGPGVAVTLDRFRRVVEVRGSHGGTIPVDGLVLEGIGAGADWLRAHATVGERITISTDLRADNRPLPVRKTTGIVNGGPFLVRDGQVLVDAYAEGFVHPGDPGFYFAFAVSRNPRTMAGLQDDGDLLLVTVDGRQPGYSIGMSFDEQARVMQALGAHDALNLDGGGSTTMAVGGALVGRPSDATGERPVGDVLTVLPSRR